MITRGNRLLYALATAPRGKATVNYGEAVDSLTHCLFPKLCRQGIMLVTFGSQIEK